MNRFRYVGVLAAAAVAAVAVGSALAATAKPTPFKAAFTGKAVVKINGQAADITATGAGVATMLGKSKLAAKGAGTQSDPCPLFGGIASMTGTGRQDQLQDPARRRQRLHRRGGQHVRARRPRDDHRRHPQVQEGQGHVQVHRHLRQGHRELLGQVHRPADPLDGYCLGTVPDFGTVPGSHQFQRPKTAISAGTSSARTIVASISTPSARPRPNSCSAATPADDEAEKRGAHDHGGGGDDLAGLLEALRDRARVVVGRVPHLAHPRDEEDLVVHRQAEERREEEDRDPALDLRPVIEAEEVGAHAPLEDDYEDPVARRRPRAG